MTPITYFQLPYCPYCAKANQAIEELTAEHPEYAQVQIDRIDDENPPADLPYSYDYYYVPTMYIGREKIFEAHPGASYDEIKEKVAKAFAAALA